MKTDSKNNLYGLLIAGAILLFGGYLIIDKFKKDKKGNNEGDIDTESESSVTSDNSTSTTNLPTKPLNVDSIVGKDVFTNTSNVNIRKSALVNNGLINNIFGIIPQKNTLIGRVESVTKKDGFNWFEVKLSREGIVAMFPKTTNINFTPKFVREDVVKLK
jgi:hypothetical protein